MICFSVTVCGGYGTVSESKAMTLNQVKSLIKQAKQKFPKLKHGNFPSPCWYTNDFTVYIRDITK